MSWITALSKNYIPPEKFENISGQSVNEFVNYHENSLENSSDYSSEAISENPSVYNVNQPTIDGNMKEILQLKEAVSKMESLVRELITSNSKYKKEVKNLFIEMDDLWDAYESVESELMQFMQYNRRENVEIVGIPEYIPDDKIEQTVIDILSRIGVNLSNYDIAGCHRMKNRKSGSTNVIVRFICRKHAKECLVNRKKLNYMVPEFQELNIVENFCPKYKSLYDYCMELKVKNKIKHIWTFNGTIFIKTSDNKNEKGKKILHWNDLQFHLK